MQRVKVYRLRDGGKWDDQGTGHVAIYYIEGSKELGLTVLDEYDNEKLLVHNITSEDIYRKQEETIISWRDPEAATELALSFQEAAGCYYIWHKICDIQRNLHFSNLGGMARPLSPDVCEEEEEEHDETPSNGEEAVANAMVLARAYAPAPARSPASRKRARPKGKGVAAEGEASGQHGGDGQAAEGEANPQPQDGNTPIPKALKSKAWKNFTKISKDNAEETVAECKICHKILRAHSKNGTSHLLRHTRSMHPHNANEVNNFFLKSKKNDDGSYALKNYKFDYESVRAGVSLFLLGGSHPFSVVQEHGYRTMMGRVCPQFKNISRITVRRDIMAMFEKERKDLIEVIHNCPGRVSFTSNNWKSDVTKFCYICITCHYIDCEWKLNKRIIWFKKLNPPCDGASIADEVHLCFREWKLDTKMMCMTLDNASYNVKMIDSLKSHLLPNGVLPLFGTFFQVRCYAHILNLVVQTGLKLIDSSVGKLRDGIQYIKASSNRIFKFYDAAESIFQLNATRRLKVDMPVRWNSTYTMLENSLYFKDVFLWFAERDSIFKSNFLPSYDEWDKLATMLNFLKIFYDVTCIFSGTKHPTSNLYFKYVYMVHTRLLEAHAAGKKFMAPMLADMKEKFDKYWSDYSIFLSCAAVLDPRYKLRFISYCYSKLYPNDDAQRRVNEVRTTLTNLFEEYRGTCGNRTSDVAAHNTTSGSGVDLFNDYEEFIVTSRTQLDLYLDEPARGLHETFDVLEYWSKSSMRYPELASMARDVLAIPVSSVASESAFSMRRKVITSNWNALKPKTVEALMCLQDWYRSKMEEGEADGQQAESSNAPPSVDEASSESE